MTKNPSATFYFNDWENDENLKACSLAAQGLWMRLLCIAARSPEHGVAQIGDLICSLPDGLAHIALAVGRPLQEIVPLIGELLSSGAASQDRKKRIVNRRMVRAAALSAKRSKCGKLGAQVTNGKDRGKEDLPRQNSRQTVGPSRLPDSESSSHNHSPDIAARASASPDGPPRSRLPDSAKWAERLEQFKPWMPHGERGKWDMTWGPRPDSAGRNPIIPPLLYAEWRAKYNSAMEAQTA